MTTDTPERDDDLGQWVGLWDEALALVALIAAFLAVRLYALPALLAAASDKAYFAANPLLLDLRAGGYSAQTALEYMRALGPSGRDYAAVTFIPVYDTALALTGFVFAMLFILHTTQPNRRHALQVRLWPRRLLLVPPLLQALADVAENLTLLTLITAFPRLDADVVKAASLLTQFKWSAVFVSAIVIVSLGVHSIYRMGSRQP